MANLFVERRPDGTYAVREANNPRAIGTGSTQEEAIRAAHEARPGVNLDIERVRDTDTGKPDKWRAE